MHSKYKDNEAFSAEDQDVIVDLLRRHPRGAEKIGCGAKQVHIALHPKFSDTRCLYIDRTDGTTEDFSVRKVILTSQFLSHFLTSALMKCSLTNTEKM